ncbi:helix-turn-helix domain-containing protein [Acidithiobacillus sp. AMEEHan]|uniref:helix-turn-helix domain-containing protein n=1 Tax=Acidithiobacillus sp. AMEEHan TaxID=2994951 RepID=UPI0027E54B94|nr:helix-turn-helix domain-containing protein [Acidithiobacillus sp. AMEEHan]
MQLSTATVSMLTGKSTKTIYRWVDDGQMKAATQDEGGWTGGKIGGKLLFSLSDIAPFMTIPVTTELENALNAAEKGMAEGFNEVGLIFFENKVYDIAFVWFNMAAKKGHLDAMDWLSTCYIEGFGTEADLARGIEWLGKAAAGGHSIAAAKIKALNQ